MYQNQDGTYVYLVVPEKYNCVYEQLLIKISDLGVDMIKDCSSTCRGINRAVINCWNMFQAACASYTLGEEKKADLMINYITAQLKLQCPYYCTDDQKPAITDFSLDIDYTDGDSRAYINTAIFTLTNPQNVLPNSLCIHQINCGNKIIIFHQDIHSPVNVGIVPFDIKANTNYIFMATVKDKWNNVIESNHFTWNGSGFIAPEINNLTIDYEAVYNKNIYTVNFKSISFNIINSQNAEPNTLNCVIYHGNNQSQIITNASWESGIALSSSSIKINPGSVYGVASIKDINGNIYYSNRFEFTLNEPTETDVYYYGSGEAPSSLTGEQTSNNTEIDFIPNAFKLWIASKNGKKPYSILSNPGSVFEHEEYDEQYITTTTVDDYTIYCYDYGAMMTFPVKVKLR